MVEKNDAEPFEMLIRNGHFGCSEWLYRSDCCSRIFACVFHWTEFGAFLVGSEIRPAWILNVPSLLEKLYTSLQHLADILTTIHALVRVLVTADIGAAVKSGASLVMGVDHPGYYVQMDAGLPNSLVLDLEQAAKRPHRPYRLDQDGFP